MRFMSTCRMDEWEGGAFGGNRRGAPHDRNTSEPHQERFSAPGCSIAVGAAGAMVNRAEAGCGVSVVGLPDAASAHFCGSPLLCCEISQPKNVRGQLERSPKW